MIVPRALDQALAIFSTHVGRIDKRTGARKLTYRCDNVRAEDRKRLIERARHYHCFAVAIVINAAERICQDRNRSRPERDFGPHVVRRQITDLKRGLRGLEREGFRYVHILNGRRGCRNPPYAALEQQEGSDGTVRHFRRLARLCR